MNHRWTVALLALALYLGGCTLGPSTAPPLVSSITIDGTDFAIRDAAIASDCLSLVFAVNGYTPPPGTDPQRAFPPAESFAIRAIEPDLALNPVPLGGGGGGGGEDGRVWMEQEMHYALAEAVPEKTEVTLEILATLNAAFGQPAPLEYRIGIVAGPGGGRCAALEAAP
jgi:hypothetical protein